MKGFNLSEWAIRNRSVVVFIMIVSVAAGVAAFFKLGRAEDPPFTFRTMLVSAAWPGATLDDTLKQVTERLERTLQEVPNLDNLRSFTRPGVSTIFVDLRGDTDARAVEDTWYQVRKKVADMRGTLPQGIVGPGFNDEFGDTYGIIYGFTADGFSHRELRDYVEEVRSKLLRVPDVAKVDVLGAQDERIFIEFDMRTLAGLGFAPDALVTALAAQNLVRPTGIMQTGDESISQITVTNYGDSLLNAPNTETQGEAETGLTSCREEGGSGKKGGQVLLLGKKGGQKKGGREEGGSGLEKKGGQVLLFA